MFKIESSDVFGARVERRLRDEEVIWLTAVRPDGIPQPNPVWFLWDSGTIIIFSEPNAKKVSHIRANPHVALNFNTSAEGGDVIVITGEARIETEPLSAPAYTAYMAKYRQGITELQMTPESYAAQFGAIIRVTPEYLRGFN